MAEHLSYTIMRLHLSDPACTKASVGVLYGLAIAARPPLEADDWEAIHGRIIERWPARDAKHMLQIIDGIKTTGWKLHGQIAKALEDNHD